MLPGCSQVAELDEGTASRFGRRHAGGKIRIDAQVDVGLQLGVDLIVYAIAAKEVGNAAKGSHGDPFSNELQA